MLVQKGSVQAARACSRLRFAEVPGGSSSLWLVVGGGGLYRVFRNDAAVDLQNKRGRRYSDASSDLWNVTKAVIDADGFDVLLTGSGRLDGQYLVWDVGTDGVIARANGWSTSQRLTQLGYGALFT